MRGFTVAMSILAALIIGITVYVTILDKSVARLTEQLLEVTDAAEQGQWERCDEAMQNLLENWERQHSWVSMFVQHLTVDTIRENLHRMKEYVRFRNEQEIMAHAAVLSQLLKQVTENEAFTLQNLF